MVRHNNVVPNAHFKKDWQNRVQCWFNQPGRKQRRRVSRQQKAVAIAPRPVAGLVRPAVRCPTAKYNSRMRSGRGFTLDEIKEAGLSAKVARTVGIAVDHRRKSRSVEALNRNVQRLKEYNERLIVFPKRAGKAKKGDASAEDIKAASQLTGAIIPVTQQHKREKARAITEEEKNFNAFYTLRMARANAKYVGVREKRAIAKAEAAAAAANKKK
ncbi:50S ribosomal protein L13e [Sphaeroforma arctica JP610]|uniref:60S ribosomal protein L13 n=1 Tax=Sphaeroforma arctica JP610 TaxID=667725 RepID=A0A0L0G8W9_9EUKA|nr:50S ribosomal protein L13e [Sphaeroforma arctica JP610]KNC85477.1 50S ribosomal protein L13e [Sphaeroforma arctica JP610]|eukprot:XP_014159379.1 50S ribosomal protein L13e [Sphaeroforma arctica JP610]